VGEIPKSVLVIKWKSGKKEEYRLFDRIRIRLSSLLKTPIKLLVTVVTPEKRGESEKGKEFNSDLQDLVKEDAKERLKKLREKTGQNTQLAMILEEQLAVGIDDFW